MEKIRKVCESKGIDLDIEEIVSSTKTDLSINSGDIHVDAQIKRTASNLVTVQFMRDVSISMGDSYYISIQDKIVHSGCYSCHRMWGDYGSSTFNIHMQYLDRRFQEPKTEEDVFKPYPNFKAFSSDYAIVNVFDYTNTSLDKKEDDKYMTRRYSMNCNYKGLIVVSPKVKVFYYEIHRCQIYKTRNTPFDELYARKIVEKFGNINMLVFNIKGEEEGIIFKAVFEHLIDFHQELKVEKTVIMKKGIDYEVY
uniref:Uncharacterized protein n=1 Tax=Acrobeloides nanus TaxID=290746 RepID=A0A914DLC9_9BILA